MRGQTNLRYDGRVALVTGAGRGIGRAHALLLGSRGARVVVNDVDAAAAEAVAAEIRTEGNAIAVAAPVEDGEHIVAAALAHFGALHIVVNNAGNLRDRAFHNLTEEEWKSVYDVHLLGAMRVTRAAWRHLREQRYGRVVMTSSGSGLFGWFGQANYAMAKAGTIGLAKTLAMEGRARDILVNTVCPMAGSALSATVWPPSVVAALRPEFIAPLAAVLCHDSCPTTGAVFETGGGWVSEVRLERTRGLVLRKLSGAPEELLARWNEVTDFTDAEHPRSALDCYRAARAVMDSDVASEWDRFIEQLEARIRRSE